MSQRNKIAAGSLAILMSISHATNAQNVESQQIDISDELTEAFIGLRIGNGGSSFYKVLVNADEDPYINIDSFLTHLIGVTPECDIGRFVCTVLLPGEKEPHWVDGKSLRMSEGKTDKEIDLMREDIVKSDGAIWLHYEALEKWMPLKSIWSLRSYELAINPLFVLPKDRIGDREKQRRRLMEEKKERLEKRKREIIQVPEIGNQFYEARGQLIGAADTQGNANASFSLDVGADILRGRLQAGSLITGDEIEPLEYWQYERFDNPFGEYLGLGQVFYSGNLIESSRVLENGFRFARKYEDEGVGEFTLDATVPEEAVVDVYKNGFYEDTLIADELGQVVLQDIQASSGDVITLKSISKEGIESDQTFKISGSINQYLDKNDWDYEFVGGSEGDGDISALSFRYGLQNNLTTGLSLKRVSTQMDEKVSALASFAYRPHHRVAFRWQQEFGENNWAYSTDLSLWKGNDVRIFGQSVRDDSLAFGSKTKTSFHGVEHEWGSPRWQTQSKFIESENERSFRERFGLKLNTRWDLRLEGERAFRKDINTTLDRWQASSIYALPNGSKFEGGFSGGDFGSRWFAGLRWLGETEAPWSDREGRNRFSFNVNVESIDGFIEPNFDLKWHHGESISGSFAISRDFIKAQARWKFGFAKKTGKYKGDWHRQEFDHFRRGSAEGRLMTPKTTDMESRPLADTTLWFSNVKVVTDNEGYFVAEGLPTNDTIKTRIDVDSLPIDLMPEKQEWGVKIRPGTVLNFDPPLIWSVGVDGYVEQPGYRQGVKLVFEHESLGILAEVEVEGDGFFIAERLAPGDYTVKVLYPNEPPERVSLTIDEDRSWISDISIAPEKT